MHFLTNLINWSSSQWEMIALIAVLLIGFAILFIRHWIRYVLIIPVIVIALFFLWLLVIPLYPQGPNGEWFFRQGTNMLFIFPDATAKSTSQIVIIHGDEKPTVLSTQQETQQSLKEGDITKINFVSQQPDEKTLCFIQLHEGTLIQLYPQSSLLLSGRYPLLDLQALQGKISFSPSPETAQATITMTWIIKDTSISTEKSGLFSAFEQKKTDYLIQQWWTFMDNQTMNQLSKYFLEILNKIFPSLYSKNLQNYNDFQQYIQKIEALVDTKDTAAIQTSVANQAEKGRQETKLYQRRKQLTQ